MESSEPLLYSPDPPDKFWEHQEISVPISADPASPSTSTTINLHRSHAHHQLPHPSIVLRPCNPFLRQSFLLLSLYLSLGVAIYSLFTSHFSSNSRESHPVVDALYFCIVTMCTIGYGGITPATPFAKLFSISFLLLGFGFLHIFYDILRPPPPESRNRMKVGLALSVVFLCVAVGVAVLVFVERLGWLDAFYLSVMSVTTVGYGDPAFKTVPGRLFASVWLLVSTVALVRAFLYLAEARIDERRSKIAELVLARDMTVSEFLAADIDDDGFVSKSEFVIYKLKEMGKIVEKDMLQICHQFDKLDTGNRGKIRLWDLTEAHHRH